MADEADQLRPTKKQKLTGNGDAKETQTPKAERPYSTKQHVTAAPENITIGGQEDEVELTNICKTWLEILAMGEAGAKGAALLYTAMTMRWGKERVEDFVANERWKEER